MLCMCVYVEDIVNQETYFQNILEPPSKTKSYVQFCDAWSSSKIRIRDVLKTSSSILSSARRHTQRKVVAVFISYRRVRISYSQTDRSVPYFFSRFRQSVETDTHVLLTKIKSMRTKNYYYTQSMYIFTHWIENT